MPRIVICGLKQTGRVCGVSQVCALSSPLSPKAPFGGCVAAEPLSTRSAGLAPSRRLTGRIERTKYWVVKICVDGLSQPCVFLLPPADAGGKCWLYGVAWLAAAKDGTPKALVLLIEARGEIRMSFDKLVCPTRSNASLIAFSREPISHILHMITLPIHARETSCKYRSRSAKREKRKAGSSKPANVHELTEVVLCYN